MAAAKQLREAGEGAFLYALSQYGWSEEKIQRSMKTWRDSWAHELAEEIRNSEYLHIETDGHMHDCIMAADLIDPGAEDDGSR